MRRLGRARERRGNLMDKANTVAFIKAPMVGIVLS